MYSIRWKLVAAFLLAVFIPCYLIHRHAISFFDRYTREALEKEMIAYAFLIGEQYRSQVLDAPEAGRAEAWGAFESLLKKVGPDIQSRLRIISPSGEVLADSHDDSSVGKYFFDRPELKTAIAGKYGSRSALTDDRQYLYYYISLPVLGLENEVRGIVYVSRHTGPIIHAIKEMRSHQRRGMLIAVLIASLTAILLAFTITIRLRRLTRAARAVGRAGGPLEATIRGRDEIGELSRSLTQMASELDRRNRYNRDFISETMHELKTPLTAIKGAVEILESGAAEKPETRRKFLGNIRHETDRLIRMVGELTQLTKLDAEVFSGLKEIVDYCDFVRAFVERIRPTLEAGQAELKLRVPEAKCPVSILPGKIEQVITNLLENAFRYTPASGTVELSVAPGTERTVVTTIRDTGVGIPPAIRERVFDRFFTTELKGSEKAHGSGLGLAIAKSIVEHHGGKIWVESAPGRGSAFSFSLKISP